MIGALARFGSHAVDTRHLTALGGPEILTLLRRGARADLVLVGGFAVDFLLEGGDPFVDGGLGGEEALADVVADGGEVVCIWGQDDVGWVE